jgi:hypothetical protein
MPQASSSNKAYTGPAAHAEHAVSIRAKRTRNIWTSSYRWYHDRGGSGRHRVRGKDCVPLNASNLFTAFSMNSFLPEPADTGHTRKELI